jgi:hypothetical protein
LPHGWYDQWITLWTKASLPGPSQREAPLTPRRGYPFAPVLRTFAQNIDLSVIPAVGPVVLWINSG